MFYLSVWFHRDRLDQVGVSTENIAATDLLRFWCGLGLGQRETDTYEMVLKGDSDSVLQNTMNLLKTLPFHNPSVRWSTF